MKRQFLFGQPVLPAKPVADGPRPLFILGAYPSALHVRWYVPGQKRPIQAVAVDNEPEPFWTGEDERQRIEHWREAVSFRDGWGRVEPCGALNGSSGAWVETRIIRALGAPRSAAWLTDCVDTYHESAGAASRLDSSPVAAAVERLGIPPRCHQQHPSENDIVSGAINGHMQRLMDELRMARPDRVVTLGNAALRVFNSLVASSRSQIRKLSPNDSYGGALRVQVDGRDVEWIPLAHPAAPAAYQAAHDLWMKRVAAPI